MELIINPPISHIAFNLFGLPIRWYSIFLTLAIFIGIFLADYFFKKKKLYTESDFLLDYSPFLILASIIGARLFYIIGNFNFYHNNPKEIIMLNHGGLSIFGAIFFGILITIILAKIKKIETIQLFDIFALVMPLCQAIGRWGNYFNQEAFGKPTQAWIKLVISKEYIPENLKEYQYFHPTFLYESILNLFLFIVLLSIFKICKPKKGTILYLYLISYSIIRFIVENYRIDSILNIGKLPIAQILCIITFIISTILLIKNTRKKEGI